MEYCGIPAATVPFGELGLTVRWQRARATTSMTSACSINLHSTTANVAEVFLGIFSALIVVDALLTAIGLYMTLYRDQGNPPKTMSYARVVGQ